MKLENRIKALIAVGASVAANCQPCLESTMIMALETGADKKEIGEAIGVGRRVRIGAASKMDEFAAGLDQATPLPGSTMSEECRCESANVPSMEGKNG